MDEQGLIASFALYTASESAEVTIVPPPRPTVELTEVERQAEQARYLGSATTLLWWLGITLAVIILIPVALLGVSRLRRRNTLPTGTLAPKTIRPVPLGGRRPGAPLSANDPRPLGPRPFIPPNRPGQ